MSLHKLSPRTVAWVAAAHVLFLLFFVLPFHFFREKQVEYIEMVNLGTQNPGDGVPDIDRGYTGHDNDPGTAAGLNTQTPPAVAPPAEQKAPPPQKPTPPPEQPVQAPTPPTPPPVTPPPPEIKPTPQEVPSKIPVKPTPPTKATPPPPTKPTPARVDQVKVNMELSEKKTDRHETASSTTSSSSKSQSTNKVDPGVNANTLRENLIRKLGGTGNGGGAPSGTGKGSGQRVGVQGGTGAGNLGSPDGINSELALYHALIKDTIQRHWQKPQLGGAAKMETYVSIKISPAGDVTFLEVARASGNSAMDDSVEQAVRAVSRLPRPLPTGVGDPNYEVTINFQLN